MNYMKFLSIPWKYSFNLKVTGSVTVENSAGNTRTVQTQTTQTQTVPNEQQRFVFAFQHCKIHL